MNDELLVDIPTACRRTSLGRTTLYAAIAERRLPVVHCGRAVRIRPADLARFVDDLAEADARDGAASAPGTFAERHGGREAK